MQRFIRILVWTIRIAVYGSLAFVLVAVLMPSPGGIFNGSQEEVAKLFVTQEIDPPLLKYKWDTGHYPTTQQGLMALIKEPAGITGWKGPYRSKNTVPLDPWKNPYHYRYPGIHNPNSYDTWSSGTPKTEGHPEDIGNW